MNAGVGANVAKAVFENGQMLLVLPRDEKAYAGAETPDTLRRLLGLPLPMRMNRLNDFLADAIFPLLTSPPRSATSPEVTATSSTATEVTAEAANWS